MPPRVKTTKDMILNAAFEIARNQGIDNVNARTVSQAIGCSTQPVLYNFSTIEELKMAVYEKADAFHSEALMQVTGCYSNPMIEIGVNYVRFAAEEQNLFKLLFQTDHFSGQDLMTLIDNEALLPVLQTLAETLHLTVEQSKEHFVLRFLMVHGLASMIANNSMDFNPDYVAGLIQKAFEDSKEEG